MIAEIPSSQVPDQINLSELQKLWDKADEARKQWVAQTRRLKDSEKQFFETKKDYDAKKQILDQDREKLNGDNREYENNQKNLKEKERAVVVREVSVKIKEEDAENNFSELQKRLLDKLVDELSTLREQQSGLRRQIYEERREWELAKDKEYRELEEYKQKVRTKFESEYQQSIERLDAEYAKKLDDLISQKLSVVENKERDLNIRESLLIDDKKRIRGEENDLNLNQEILEEDRIALAEKIKRKVALEVVDLNAKFEDVQRILGDVSRERDRVYKLLSQRDQAIKRFGDQTPEEILAETDRLKKTIQDLQEQLITRPSVSVLEQLANLRDENEKISMERSRLLQELADLRRRTNRQEMAVTELETLRDQKVLLETALTDLRTRVQDLTQKKDDKPVFPACAEMDKLENGVQEDVSVFDGDINLEEFAKDLQHRIAFDPENDKTLFYSLDDIRAFLGGLAMSKLHLLQGISGTGKTSLPLAFARAVGGGTQIVEVQASWRDREDLIGHFNAFENRFHETDFLQALYKAQTPSYIDRTFFIILDEMNLSHPEQYFADLLSALELDKNKRFISLRPEPIANPPLGFIDGRKLHIPDNIWFVGTANHDETTTDFAPKTYDRAFILELPRERVGFQINKNILHRDPISFSSLNSTFEDAKKKYMNDGLKVFNFLTINLGKFLANNFRIGWGNRLERQIMSFVPVYRAAGGELGDAADFVLTTKLLRKIKDRIENQPRELNALKRLVTSEWKNIDNQTLPYKSIQLIDDEMVRLGNETNSSD